MKNNTFDPDELLLEKDQIIAILRAIKNRWKKNKRANIVWIQAMTVLIFGLERIAPDILKGIWHDILVACNKVIELNQLYRMRGEYPTADEMTKIMIKKIEEGEIFG